VQRHHTCAGRRLLLAGSQLRGPSRVGFPLVGFGAGRRRAPPTAPWQSPRTVPGRRRTMGGGGQWCGTRSSWRSRPLARCRRPLSSGPAGTLLDCQSCRGLVMINSEPCYPSSRSSCRWRGRTGRGSRSNRWAAISGLPSPASSASSSPPTPSPSPSTVARSAEAESRAGASQCGLPQLVVIAACWPPTRLRFVGYTVSGAT
jgi:hypothetical protein